MCLRAGVITPPLVTRTEGQATLDAQACGFLLVIAPDHFHCIVLFFESYEFTSVLFQ